MNLWPPFRGAGIRVRHIARDWSEVRVELKLGLLNRNYIGTHFGGSLYAMTDPFHMLMLIHLLGPGYVVNHKGGRIEYLAPAQGRVGTTLRVDDAILEAIRARVAAEGKDTPDFTAEIVGPGGVVVARAVQTLHIRRRAAAAASER
jgi:acyl-coenzyme A thioesterase PaaI-like protein